MVKGIMCFSGIEIHHYLVGVFAEHSDSNLLRHFYYNLCIYKSCS
jgi:hypothetical protein